MPIIVDLNKHTAAEELIAQILDHARRQNLDQVTLAERAGIAPESLSRLKKGGRCRLGTALDLAHAAGLERLVVTEPPAPRGTSTSIAASKLSGGRRLPVTAEELALALMSGEPRREHRVHLLGFFEELSIESVHDVVLDEGLSYERLVALARDLGAEGETVAWLEEMAGHGLA